MVEITHSAIQSGLLINKMYDPDENNTVLYTILQFDNEINYETIGLFDLGFEGGLKV